MSLNRAQVARYLAVVVGIALSTVSIVGTLFTVDAILTTVGVDLFIPSPMVTTPIAAVVCLAGVSYGRYQAGSWSALVAGTGRRLERYFGRDSDSPPVVIGRLRHDGVVWRIHYWRDGRTKVPFRECPHCGLELSEQVLPSRIVHAENHAFTPEDPGDSKPETWEDVYTEEQAEPHREEPALACPQCQFSIPGEKRVKEGEDEAVAKFEPHGRRLERGPDGTGKLAAFANTDTSAMTPRVKARAIWDGYASTVDDDSLLVFGADDIQLSHNNV